VSPAGTTTYTVTEKSSPDSTKWGRDTGSPQKTSASLSQTACASRTTAAGDEDVKFTNVPLSKIEVQFTSSAGTGVTAAVITCKAEDGTTTLTPDPGGTTGADQSYSGLVPNSDASHNYTCTVNIDP